MHPLAGVGRLRLFGLVALLVALLAVAVLQWRQGRMVSEVMLQSTDNWASNFYEVGVEYHRLRTAWTEAVLEHDPRGDQTREGLKLRLDIFASRVGLLQESHRRRAIAARPEVEAALTQVAVFVEEAEAAFDRAQVDARPLPLGSLLLRLREQDAAVRTLTQHVGAVVAEAARESTAAVDSRIQVGVVVTAVLCLLTGFFAVVAVRQLRAAEQRRERLEAVAQDLSAARHAAERASRAKSAFLANMSHEIRTPMSAIIGLVHLLQREVTDPPQQDRLAKVEGAARHLLQVINGILDLSKIEAGKMTLELRAFEIDDVIEQAVAIVRGTAADKGLDLVVDSSLMPQHLLGDATRLSQMLINLLSNAVKFTDRGWVRLRVVPQRRNDTQLWARFEVRDTGPGIPEDQQAQLFADFEQLDASTTRRHGGTGLGLALTRRLALLMGGEAGVTSRVGAGSTFWFTVVFTCPPAAVPEPEAAALQGLPTLLVDAQDVSREAVATTLRSLGLAVESCADAAAALRHLDGEGAAPVALLLLDARLPGPAARALIERARCAPRPGTQAVLLLAHAGDAEQRRGHGSDGVDGVLSQPLVTRAWAATLTSVLRGCAEARAQRSAAPAHTELLQHHAGRRILVVEDNPINQEVAAALLEAVGLIVETAGDGARAVELVRERPYDLVLMDMQMPVLDGLGATRAIRAWRTADALPILAMTANAFGEDQRACLEAGMNEHLPKPIEAERLYHALLRWLPRSGLQRAAPVAEPLAAAAPAPVLPTLVERLAQVPGYALEQGLRCAGGDAGRLARLLTMWAGAYRDGDAGLERALERADAAALAAAAHSIRGASATVGARSVVERAQALEASARGTDAAEVQARALQLRAELSTLARALERELTA